MLLEDKGDLMEQGVLIWGSLELDQVKLYSRAVPYGDDPVRAENSAKPPHITRRRLS